MNPQPLLDWMHERHSIYLKRKAGKPKPWTNDQILRTYKFTNVFRDLDRVSQELIGLIDEHCDAPREELLFNILVFRMFNWPPTYDALAGKAGWITKWNSGTAKRILQKRKDAGEKNFTGAYVVTNQGSTQPKHIMVVDVISRFWKDRKLLLGNISGKRTVENAVAVMRNYPMVGGFIAYEFACDFTYTPILAQADDLMTWAHAGPGAKRGLNRLWGLPVTSTMHEKVALDRMRELHTYVSKRGKFPGRVVQMRDIEHSLCEFDKYERVRLGEGKPRGKFNG